MNRSFNHGTTRMGLAFGVARSAGGLAQGSVVCSLPGATPYERSFSGDLSSPEEQAAFYDDIVHEIRTWSVLLMSAITDVCGYQEQLF